MLEVEKEKQQELLQATQFQNHSKKATKLQQSLSATNPRQRAHIHAGTMYGRNFPFLFFCNKPPLSKNHRHDPFDAM